MGDENKKKILGRPFIVFLIAFLILVIILTLLALLSRVPLMDSIGTYYLFGGSIVAIIAFLFVNKGTHKGSGFDQSKYISDDNYFKKARAQEKPFERIIWSIILAGVSIAIIGYFLNSILVG